jgi:hypothetical protein
MNDRRGFQFAAAGTDFIRPDLTIAPGRAIVGGF